MRKQNSTRVETVDAFFNGRFGGWEECCSERVGRREQQRRPQARVGDEPVGGVCALKRTGRGGEGAARVFPGPPRCRSGSDAAERNLCGPSALIPTPCADSSSCSSSPCSPSRSRPLRRLPRRCAGRRRIWRTRRRRLRARGCWTRSRAHPGATAVSASAVTAPSLSWTGSRRWTAPPRASTTMRDLLGVACPASTLCLATTGSNAVLVSTRPFDTPADWRHVAVPRPGRGRDRRDRLCKLDAVRRLDEQPRGRGHDRPGGRRDRLACRGARRARFDRGVRACDHHLCRVAELDRRHRRRLHRSGCGSVELDDEFRSWHRLRR